MPGVCEVDFSKLEKGAIASSGVLTFVDIIVCEQYTWVPGITTNFYEAILFYFTFFFCVTVCVRGV